MNKVTTVDLGRGVKYAKVSDRLQAWHKASENETYREITTVVEPFGERSVLVRAKIVTDTARFEAHAVGPLSKNKDLEKLETIAVGRALAFAGFLADGAIASAEEMADFKAGESSDTRADHFKMQIKKAKNQKTLEKIQAMIRKLITDGVLTKEVGVGLLTETLARVAEIGSEDKGA